MKIRQGFVSNSSSSSFTCSVCGNTESGWDAGPADFGWVEFDCGHISCCTNVKITKAVEKKWRKEIEKEIKESKWMDEDDKKELLAIEDFEDFKEEVSNDIECFLPSEFCPICNLKSIDSDTVNRYIMAKNDLSEKEIKKEIKSKFKTLDELNDWIKDKKRKK